MGRTSSILLSLPCFRAVGLLPVLGTAMLFIAGCKTFVRIDAPADVGIHQENPALPKFCVVDCVLETHKNYTVFQGEMGGSYSQKVENLQPAFEAVCPEWFAHGIDAIPLCVKIRADVTGSRELNPLTVLPTLLSFGFIPSKLVVFFDLSTSMQLGPGEWCDAISVAAKKERMSSNLSSSAPSSEGWRTFREPVAEIEDGDANQQVVMLSQIGQFSLMQDLKDDDDPSGVDPHFALILARMIAGTWNGLSSYEKRRVETNPVARKLKTQLFPETMTTDASSNTGFAVAKGVSGDTPNMSPTPSISGYGYNKNSRRGFVEFSKNGSEHLASLKWARTEAIPKIAGAGTIIRILSEKTLENGNSRIDFEVVQ